jgi:hypothetical protein
MLARLRSFLDEDSADIFNDTTELYPALSLAQLELMQAVAGQWDKNGRKNMKELPLVIRDLVDQSGGAIAVGVRLFNLTDVILGITLKWNPAGAITAGKMCTYVGAGTIEKILENRFLEDGYYFWMNKGTVLVNPVSTDNNASYSFTYLDSPVDITASVQPVIQEVGHDAVVERACWILLKDRESEQANVHLQMYGQLLQGLV